MAQWYLDRGYHASDAARDASAYCGAGGDAACFTSIPKWYTDQGYHSSDAAEKARANCSP